MKLFCIVIAATVIALTTGQVIKPGKCPDAQVVDNFNVEKYMGVWYEQEKYPQPFQINDKCVQATYGILNDGQVSVLNSMVDKTTNAVTQISGKASLVENGKLLVKFDGIPQGNAKSNYWVLDTDYESHSVVYNCNQITPDSTYQSAWILSRNRNVDEDLIEKARKVLTKNHITLDELKVTDQVSQC